MERMIRISFVIVILSFDAVVGFRDAAWAAFKENHGKKYLTAEEEQHRKTVYVNNLQNIVEWNERFELGEVTFSMGENGYSDRTEKEYDEMKKLRLPQSKILKALRDSPFRARKKSRKSKTFFEPIELRQAPVNCTLDLRSDTCLMPVKDQGSCGSCYTFPAVCAMEFDYCKSVGTNVSIPFSEQQCLDCTKKYGNYGCGGGYYDGCFNYWKGSRIMKSSNYPYTARAGRCKTLASLGVCNSKGYTALTSWNEAGMQSTLCTLQKPMAVAFYATSLFNSYKSGIFTDPTCPNFLKTGSTSANHAVTVVGTGVDTNGTAFWLIRNSWGTSWGDAGYFKMERGTNMCNIGVDPCVVNL